MDIQKVELSLEQEFKITSFCNGVKNLSHEDAQELLCKLYRETVVREVLYQELLRHRWGIESSGVLEGN
jgi:hypothetical protein